jgi:hypothetical protein
MPFVFWGACIARGICNPDQGKAHDENCPNNDFTHLPILLNSAKIIERNFTKRVRFYLIGTTRDTPVAFSLWFGV